VIKLRVNQQRQVWWTISALMIIAAIMAMVVSFTRFNAPLRPGLDFVGGTRLQVELDCSVPGNCDDPIELAEVRDVLIQEGLENADVQIIGEQRQAIAIRTQTLDVEQRTQLTEALEAEIGTFNRETIAIETVGPTIGQELFSAGLLALIVSFFGIIVYLSFRFQFDYAFFAILAVFHDALITAGVFAFLGLVAGTEVDSLFLVAILTIIGFSVNDTVVIYDRVRENLDQRPEDNIDSVVDDAVNQTLGRSINTTLTTLLPLITIFLVGGDTLHDFALALIIGFLLGAYSTIFVASTLLAWWRERQEKKALA
jgi:preprotein translocase subunit SecF